MTAVLRRRNRPASWVVESAMAGAPLDPREIRASAGLRPAFSLVELLVVISIIALLIGLLLPALAKARASGRLARCLANQHQLAIAWAMYSDENRYFPTVEKPDWHMKLRWGWGGVHWYGHAPDGTPIDMPPWAGLPALVAARPINPYIGAPLIVEGAVEVYRCPGDSPLKMSRSGRAIDWSAFSQFSTSDEKETTVFGQLGTSYEANTSLYVQTGGQGPDPMGTNWLRRTMGPKDIHLPPSRVVLLGDIGGLAAASWNRQSRAVSDIITGWWHGKDAAILSFHDASTRLVPLGDDYPVDISFSRN